MKGRARVEERERERERNNVNCENNKRERVGSEEAKEGRGLQSV